MNEHGRESWIMSGQDSLSELSMHLLTGFSPTGSLREMSGILIYHALRGSTAEAAEHDCM